MKVSSRGPHNGMREYIIQHMFCNWASNNKSVMEILNALGNVYLE